MVYIHTYAHTHNKTAYTHVCAYAQTAWRRRRHTLLQLTVAAPPTHTLQKWCEYTLHRDTVTIPWISCRDSCSPLTKRSELYNDIRLFEAVVWSAFEAVVWRLWSEDLHSTSMHSAHVCVYVLINVSALVCMCSIRSLLCMWVRSWCACVLVR